MTYIRVTDRDGQRHELDAPDGGSLMAALRDADLGIEAICGGQCACATCHCLIDAGWFARLAPVREDERELLASLDCHDPLASRLTCQITVSPALAGLALSIAPEE